MFHWHFSFGHPRFWDERQEDARSFRFSASFHLCWACNHTMCCVWRSGEGWCPVAELLVAPCIPTHVCGYNMWVGGGTRVLPWVGDHGAVIVNCRWCVVHGCQAWSLQYLCNSLMTTQPQFLSHDLCMHISSTQLLLSNPTNALIFTMAHRTMIDFDQGFG